MPPPLVKRIVRISPATSAGCVVSLKGSTSRFSKHLAQAHRDQERAGAPAQGQVALLVLDAFLFSSAPLLLRCRPFSHVLRAPTCTAFSPSFYLFSVGRLPKRAPQVRPPPLILLPRLCTHERDPSSIPARTGAIQSPFPWSRQLPDTMFTSHKRCPWHGELEEEGEGSTVSISTG